MGLVLGPLVCIIRNNLSKQHGIRLVSFEVDPEGGSAHATYIYILILFRFGAPYKKQLYELWRIELI
jgi:hypothetical protein